MKNKKNSNNGSEVKTESSSIGLFEVNGNGDRIRLPLKAVDARFQVQGDCAEVVLEQVFEHTGKNPVDVLYTFPLPANAAVHRCEMKLGNRVICAKVKPEKEARREFKEQKAKGRRAAIVESVRENLFELQLGNVQPGDHPVILLAMIMPLIDNGTTERRLRIPSCPGIRYVPGQPVGADGGTDLVPDAGRLNPPRVLAEHADAALFFCAGTIQGATNIESPSHHIECVSHGTRRPAAVMLNQEDSVPDRDFILTWIATGEPVALCSTEDSSYLLCSVRTPDDLPQQRTPRDIFFLLDCSGSMEGIKWDSLTSAFALALKELGEKDHISVALFESKLHHITSGLISSSKALSVDLPNQLKSFGTRGGTEFTEAFSSTIKSAKSARRPVIMIITDGEFGDEERASSLAASCGIEVHAIGIDTVVNESALQAISRRTRGSCALCVPGEDLKDTVHAIMKNLLSPGIEKILASDEWEPAGPVPPLRAGQSALVPFRRAISANAGQKDSTQVNLTLVFSDQAERKIRVPIQTVSSRAPLLLAVKAEITDCLDKEEEEQGVSIACRHNILCKGAAFIAFDESENVPVANAVLEQANIEPHLWCAPMPMAMECCLKLNEARKPRPSLAKMLAQKTRLNASVSSKSLSKHLKSKYKIHIFDQKKWGKIFIQELMPWAESGSAHLQMLEKALYDLEALGKDRENLAQALAILRSLIPFIPDEVAEAIEIFCKDQETMPANGARKKWFFW
jgi:Ca-activated chloride channel family protein